MIRTALAAIALAAMPLSTAPAGAEAVQSPDAGRAMEFLSALGQLDFEAAGSFLDEEAVLDLPYAGEGVTVRGRTAILGFFRKTMGASTGAIAYRLDKAYPSTEAGSVVLEISTQGRTAAGREYTNRLVGIFVFRDGRIVLFREYFNPGRLG